MENITRIGMLNDESEYIYNFYRNVEINLGQNESPVLKDENDNVVTTITIIPIIGSKPNRDELWYAWHLMTAYFKGEQLLYDSASSVQNWETEDNNYMQDIGNACYYEHTYIVENGKYIHVIFRHDRIEIDASQDLTGQFRFGATCAGSRLAVLPIEHEIKLISKF